MRRCFGVAAAALLACAATAAEDGGRFYFGAGLDVASQAFEEAGISLDDTAVGATLYGGLQLRERVAVEGSLLSFPNVSSGETLGSGVSRLAVESRIDMLLVRGVLSLYLGDVFPRALRWTLFGTAGAFSSRENRRVVELTTAAARSATISDSGMVLGAGVLYDFDRLRLRALIEGRDGRHIDQTAIGVTAEFRF